MASQKAFPIGVCYCGCKTVLEDRTAFFVRGHDAVALHRIVKERYGTTADFLLAHGEHPNGAKEEGSS